MTILLGPTAVTVTLDSLEMDTTVQVCGRKKKWEGKSYDHTNASYIMEKKGSKEICTQRQKVIK